MNTGLLYHPISYPLIFVYDIVSYRIGVVDFDNGNFERPSVNGVNTISPMSTIEGGWKLTGYSGLAVTSSIYNVNHDHNNSIPSHQHIFMNEDATLTVKLKGFEIGHMYYIEFDSGVLSSHHNYSDHVIM